LLSELIDDRTLPPRDVEVVSQGGERQKLHVALLTWLALDSHFARQGEATSVVGLSRKRDGDQLLVIIRHQLTGHDQLWTRVSNVHLERIMMNGMQLLGIEVSPRPERVNWGNRLLSSDD
jgi:hypothetical protein